MEGNASNGESPNSNSRSKFYHVLVVNSFLIIIDFHINLASLEPTRVAPIKFDDTDDDNK